MVADKLAYTSAMFINIELLDQFFYQVFTALFRRHDAVGLTHLHSSLEKLILDSCMTLTGPKSSASLERTPPSDGIWISRNARINWKRYASTKLDALRSLT